MLKIALVFCHIDEVFSNYKAGVFSIFESNPPLGLCSVGTIAKNKGHSVKIFDQLLRRYTLDQLVVAIENFAPDMIGFACTSLNIETSISCAKKLKADTGCICFAGGIHVTLCTNQVAMAGAFDFLLSGEGEELFDSVLSTLENRGMQGVMNINKIGFWSTSSNEDKGMAVLSDINQPILDRSLMEITLYSNKGALLEERPCYSLFSSRGCPFSCKFCSKPSYFRKYRHRNINNVMAEIHVLIDKYGAKAISFREDNFTADEKYLQTFCQSMEDEFQGKLPWECESRAELSKNTIQMMYNAGCRGIWCGIETMVPKWNDWINKKLKKEDVLRFYYDCKQIGIKTGALFMFGFPYQTNKEIYEDIDFAMSLPTEFSAFQCMAIFPGSPLLNFYKKHPELCYNITKNVAIALTKGYTYQDMIQKEHDINKIIKSNRIF